VSRLAAITAMMLLLACGDSDTTAPRGTSYHPLSPECQAAVRFITAPGDEFNTPYYWEVVRWYMENCVGRVKPLPR
jgi:hypothetical protein